MSDATFTPEEVAMLKKLAAFLLSSGANGASSSNGAGGEATDEELDGRNGDPTVRKDPARWAGDSYAGSRYSDCPSDYLRVLAEALDYFAAKDEKLAEPRKHRNGTPWHVYNRKDARLARGWARRNAGEQRDAPAPRTDTAERSDPNDGYGPSAGDDEIPF